MPRLLGVEIPGNKKLAYSLRYVYGIGLTRALDIVKTTKLDPDKRARDLNEEELNKITEAITHSGYKIEGDLRREIIGNIKRLQAIRCYRGLRHLRGLPVRGQRTQTNARTRKGARKTVGVVTKK
ncbi:MAG: 30S ribosomal protein S13 [Puniceicoccales bacterium]|jgi:small subunit ribosomal protein S13|nr:30S ribosomal protein S13 [Puniceicoccales bacterium]